MKILIIEDERDLLDSIVSYLKGEGFLCEQAPDYLTAEDKLAVHEYDLVILDITLPDGNGLELIKNIKNLHTQTGILIISAKNSLDDKLKGLDFGADDYITKPFHLAELNSRINAINRRRNLQGKERLTFHEIEIVTSAKQVYVKGEEMDLTKKEYELLLYLIINKNRVITREAVAEHLWGDQIDFVDNYDFIYTHIKNLRRKIREKGGEDYLKTVYGMGYKFTEK
ncbi:MAG: response regulator transcription factor [Bacteroidales bacterium]|nr:response regulator transcription factor [Bacteroidales bacterium]